MSAQTKRLGIVGGLGPETSSQFCLEINREFRRLTGAQPDFVLENVPVPVRLEQEAIRGGNSENLQKLLIRAVDNLNQSGAEIIALPCNSVHVFIDKLRRISSAPILSIVEECAQRCQERRMSRAGLLATQMTVSQKLFSTEFAKWNIDIIPPTKSDQRRINTIILKIIDGKAGNEEKRQLLGLVQSLQRHGAEGIILGCTDLPLLLSEKDCPLPVFDTSKILREACLAKMIRR